MASRIIPSGHKYDVNKDQSALVYYIMTGKTVDIGKIIQASIFHGATGNSTIVLPNFLLSLNCVGQLGSLGIIMMENSERQKPRLIFTQ